MPERAPLVVAYIAAGSNIEPRRNLAAAMDALRHEIDLTAVSTVYRTPAIDRPEDPDFLNCVFAAETAIGPRELKLDVLRGIEDSLGRQRGTDKYAPRRIDLDLILYGNAVIDEPDLKIPHPDISRWFVRVPLLELAGELELPTSGRKLSDLAGLDLEPRGAQPLAQFTESLRRRLRE